MARSDKSFAGLLMPHAAKSSRPRKPVSAAENPSIQAIWDRVCAIPRGQVSTYGSVARAAGLPGRARLTGLALKVAPDAMNLPWHRVVGAGGRIVFPKTSGHHREQARRLRADGVLVKDGRVNRAAIVDLEDI